MNCTNSQIHDLLMQLQQGNDEAAEQLFVCIADVLCRSAITRGLSYEDADDTVQKTMLRILDGGINSYKRGKGGGWGWIWIIHRRVIIDLINKNRGRQGKELPLDNIGESSLISEENPEQEIINRESNEELLKSVVYVLQNISEKDREALFNGRGTGPGRKEWHAAVERVRSALESYYNPPTD